VFHDCLKTIIDCVPQCILEYQNMIFDTVEKVITSMPSQASDIITLVRHINQRSSESYLPQMNFILPKVLQIIESKRYNSDFMRIGMPLSSSAPSSSGKQAVNKSQLEDFKICKEALQMIQELKRVTKDDNLHLIVPLLVRVISRSNNNEQKDEVDFKIEIVRTIKSLVGCKSFREYIATIVHTMINVIEVYLVKETGELYRGIVELFCEISRRLKIDFAPFIPLVLEQFKRNKRPSSEFNLEVEKITKIDLIDLFKKNLETDQQEDTLFREDSGAIAGARSTFQSNMYGRNQDQRSMAQEIEMRRLFIDIDLLMKDFDTEKISIEADWNEWLKKTSFQLLKQSPNPILYACSTVAEVYSPIASELYNVAFLSLWKILNDNQKNHIMQSIKKSTQSSVQPRGVLQTILNLHEFMELDENKQKMFDERTLAEIAE
jgi:FKBP12-rapamycin complex-associated protein